MTFCRELETVVVMAESTAVAMEVALECTTAICDLGIRYKTPKLEVVHGLEICSRII